MLLINFSSSVYVYLTHLINESNMSNKEEPNSDESSDIQLDLVSSRICQVIIPVTLCSLYVTILVRILERNVNEVSSIIDRTWSRLGLAPSDTDTLSSALVNNIIIVSVFIILVVVVTLVVLFIFYMEWHGCLTYYFYLPSLIIMAILSPVYFRDILMSLNWFGIDLISLLVLNWNFTALGMIAIFHIYLITPLYLQQFYLIHNSAILAVLIIRSLPSWTPWLLLTVLVLWDLFAVLAPFGPLNLIVNMAEKEGVIGMPGLIYTTDPGSELDTEPNGKKARFTGQRRVLKDNSEMTDANQTQIDSLNTIESDTTPKFATSDEAEVDEANKEASDAKKSPRANKEDSSKQAADRRLSMQEKGVDIGLGDFIFYSLLVGVTVKGRNTEDYYATLASMNAILVGLVLTLVILALTRRTLPALPISIALGLIVTPLVMSFAKPFSNKLAEEQIFI